MALANRHVLVTGADGALGSAVVAAFGAAGAVVHAPARNAVPAGVQKLPRVDVTDDAAVRALYAALPPLWASVHVVGGFAMGALVDATVDDARRMLDINFTSAFLCTREAARQMRGRAGRIVNVASHAAEAAPAQLALYAASKAAVIALTRAAAAELRSAEVLVNAVAPTTIDTPANRAAMPGADRSLWASPADIAATIVWLASPDNHIVTGAVVPVGG